MSAVVAPCWINKSGLALSFEDWSLVTGGTTQEQISSNMKKLLRGNHVSIVQLRATRLYYMLCQGSKSPGLIILQHELTNDTAEAFINNYYLIPDNNWISVSAAQMDGMDRPYQNAIGTTGAVTYSPVVGKQNSVASTVKPRNTNGVVRTSTSAILAYYVAALTGVAAWLS